MNIHVEIPPKSHENMEVIIYIMLLVGTRITIMIITITTVSDLSNTNTKTTATK